MNIIKMFSVFSLILTLTVPALASDKNISRPSNLAQNDYININQRIKSIAKHTQLVYFFRSNCLYCYRFTPTLKRFASEYGFTILPITLDGRAVHEFPNAKTLPEQFMDLDIPVVPTVYLLESTTGKLIPITYGSINVDQLRQRILDAG